MLTTSRASRRRLFAGIASVAVIVATGLGVTASGTSAAAAITGKVGETIGVDLQAAPPAPPAPAIGAVPPAPAAPVAPAAGADTNISTVTVDGDGKAKKRYRIIVRDKDGHVTTEDYRGDMAGMPAMPNMPPIPEVTERACTDGKDGGPKQFVLHSAKGDRQIMVICKNRIEKAASDGAAMAMRSKDIEKQAIAAAVESLRAAKASLAANKGLTDAQRQEAMAGIDESLVELQSETGGDD